MTHKPDRNRKRISTAASIKGLTAVLKCMLASIFLTCLLPASSLYGQKIAVKSNLLYDLTTTFNIGGEIRCDDTHTLNLSVNYNPWNFGGNKKMKHFMLQPEYRKWFDRVFMGSYIENRQIANNRYQGNLAGFGISYGYQWMISPQWNLEAGLSLGYAHLNYKRYGQPEGAAFIEKSHCNYWGPTQIGISLVYFIQ